MIPWYCYGWFKRRLPTATELPARATGSYQALAGSYQEHSIGGLGYQATPTTDAPGHKLDIRTYFEPDSHSPENTDPDDDDFSSGGSGDEDSDTEIEELADSLPTKTVPPKERHKPPPKKRSKKASSTAPIPSAKDQEGGKRIPKPVRAGILQAEMVYKACGLSHISLIPSWKPALDYWSRSNLATCADFMYPGSGGFSPAVRNLSSGALDYWIECNLASCIEFMYPGSAGLIATPVGPNRSSAALDYCRRHFGDKDEEFGRGLFMA
ncbi:hypothetical protein B0H10DRAFT_1949050 [Mycena sp. CBHHK59/15]|nr:hypothetical protein B0H10DRAFT_1949050 [Mycena sp. CBHHK59/15]